MLYGGPLRARNFSLAGEAAAPSRSRLGNANGTEKGPRRIETSITFTEFLLISTYFMPTSARATPCKLFSPVNLQAITIEKGFDCPKEIGWFTWSPETRLILRKF